MSMIAKEVSGLVGAYIRAWFWGALLGAMLTLWAMSGSSVPDEGLRSCVASQKLPCYEQQCLEAFGFYIEGRKESVEQSMMLAQ